MIPLGISPNSPSFSTYYLRMQFSETQAILATGTGFTYEFDQTVYMITNGHNVTGVNPETNTRLSNHIGFPDVIVSRAKAVAEDGNQYLHPTFFYIDLYENKDTTKPLWYIHPKYGYDVDVVAIPICKANEVPNHLKLYPINNFDFNNEVYVQIADDVFVLGYPYDINGGKELPIWKRGSIASEPSLNLDNLPKILIDTATRPGMSGSPVLFRRTGLIKIDETPGFSPNDIIGTVQGFLGVYSGRIHSNDKFEAQLGIVWKSEVIEEIINGKRLGDTKFQYL